MWFISVLQEAKTRPGNRIPDRVVLSKLEWYLVLAQSALKETLY